MESGFYILVPRFLVSGTWIRDSLELNAIFQGQEFWIPQLKISQTPESVLPFIGRSGEGEQYLLMDVNNKILRKLHKNLFELTNACFVVFSQPVSFQTKTIITSFGVVAQL